MSHKIDSHYWRYPLSIRNVLEKASQKTTKIPFSRPTLSKEELETVLDCLVDDHLYTGSVVERFEKEFKSTFGFKYCISVNSLTSAYHLSLISLGIKENDPVLLSSYAPIQALDAILLLRAKPIVVDIARSSFHISPDVITKEIENSSPKAILLDHAFGCVLDISKYNIVGIPVIEDFSEVVGADSTNVQIGKQGMVSICGLGENHVITTGNGAMICTKEPILAESIINHKFHIHKTRKEIKMLYDYNLIDYQAAMGIEQLSKIGVILERKKKIATVYLQAVLSASHETYFKSASEDQFNRFVIIVSKPYDEILRYFNAIEIGTERTHTQPIHRLLDMSNSDYPNAERLYQRGHCIPIYPNLTRDNVNRVASSIRGIY